MRCIMMLYNHGREVYYVINPAVTIAACAVTITACAVTIAACETCCMSFIVIVVRLEQPHFI